MCVCTTRVFIFFGEQQKRTMQCIVVTRDEFSRSPLLFPLPVEKIYHTRILRV